MRLPTHVTQSHTEKRGPKSSVSRMGMWENVTDYTTILQYINEITVHDEVWRKKRTDSRTWSLAKSEWPMNALSKLTQIDSRNTHLSAPSLGMHSHHTTHTITVTISDAPMP